MKKIFAALLAALMIFSLCACKKKDEDGGSNIDMSVTADKNIFETGNEFGDTFTYQVVNGNEISITGFDGSDVPHAVTLPLSIHDYAVTEVGAGAFYQKSNLLSVTVPEGIKKIGNFAFSGCTQMTGVTLPAMEPEPSSCWISSRMASVLMISEKVLMTCRVALAS